MPVRHGPRRYIPAKELSMALICEKTPLPGVLLFKPQAFGDHRGFFQELFRIESYAEAGINRSFVQDNHSRSTRGTLRGLHYQLPDCQGKLVFVPRGRVFDVAVDIRRGSPTFGRWYGAILDDENHHQLWVPPGLAHGFCVLSEIADFMYKCTEYYKSEQDRGFLWNDPDVGVDWPITGAPVISAKDHAAPRLADVPQESLPVFQG